MDNLSEDEIKELREDFKSAMIEAKNLIRINKSRFSFSSEEARKLGDSMMEHYLKLTKSVTKEKL